MTALPQVALEASTCVKCDLASTRTQVVFGVGTQEADLMIVGEAPGRDEDLAGEPFVGRAGKLLTDLLAQAGVPRSEIYIANVLKCRPPGNRDPRPEEITSCRPWLEQQIELVDPLLICTVGNFSTKLLLNTKVGITRLRGKTYRFGERWILPTFHPSAALRSGPSGNTHRDLETDLREVASVLVRLRKHRDKQLAEQVNETESPA